MVVRKWFALASLAVATAFLFGCGSGPGGSNAPGPKPSDVEQVSPADAAQLPKGVPATPAVAVNQPLGNGAVTLKGYTLRKDEGLTEIVLYWQDAKPVSGQYSALLHMFPSDPSVLPADRKASGFLNVDHDPLVETSSWQAGKTYLSLHRGAVAPGAYRVLTGLYTGSGKTSRMKPDKPATGTKEKDAIDLGEIRIP